MTAGAPPFPAELTLEQRVIVAASAWASARRLQRDSYGRAVLADRERGLAVAVAAWEQAQGYGVQDRAMTDSTAPATSAAISTVSSR